MNMIDRQQRLLSPEQLAEWTPAHRRMYARRLPKSWPMVEQMLEMSERALDPEPPEDPVETPEPAETVPRRVYVSEIIEACARCAMVSILELRSPRRARSIVRTRQLAMYLAIKHTDRSLPEIGRRLGGKDHSTVIHARKRVQADLDAGGDKYKALKDVVERELGVA